MTARISLRSLRSVGDLHYPQVSIGLDLRIHRSSVRYRRHYASLQHASTKTPTVAIVGSGPAGFYTAQKLMREFSGTKIDMYEQLPVPFGLVRFGVAPDHPEVKNCQDSFQEVAESPQFTFIGNVNLGHDLPLQLLSKHYDAIVFAYGASKDRQLGLDGEEKAHIYSARAFVGWYNGLPEYRNLNPDLLAGDTAVVIGQGNVALDVARVLLSKIEVLKKTDITQYALDTLSTSTIKHVHVVGRRGPLQAAFTIKEIRELFHLDDVNFKPIPKEYFGFDIAKFPRPKKRMMELLKKGSPHKPSATKSWSLDFLLSPSGLQWSEKSTDTLERVKLNRTRLDDPSSPDSKVVLTDETTTLATSTLFRSIGYKAEAILGMKEIGANFNDRKGMIEHDGVGRIVPFNAESSSSSSPTASSSNATSPPASLYCAGWVKRGPTGVIASTMIDAFQTAETVVHDWKTLTPPLSPKDGWQGVLRDAKQANLALNPVHWDRWKQIDRFEKKAGEISGKPREKLGTVKEMLDVAGE